MGSWPGRITCVAADCLRPILLAASGKRHHSIERCATAASASWFDTCSLANTRRRWVFRVCGEMNSHLGLAVITWLGQRMVDASGAFSCY
jgi:hypothetical protein